MKILKILTSTTVVMMLAFSSAAVVMTNVANAASVVKYNATSFNNALKNGKSVVVHVHASWCIVCTRQMKPLRATLAKPSYAKVKAYQVNYDKDRSFLKKYRVSSQSTILVFKRGKLVAKSVGQTSPSAIATVVRKAL